MRLGLFWALFVASIKMFVRNRAAVFFSLFVPLLIMLIFGVLNFGGTTSVSVGFVDEAHSAVSARLLAGLQQNPAFSVHTGTGQEELTQLEQGHRDLVLRVPAGYQPGREPLPVTMSSARQQQAQIGQVLLAAAVGQTFFGPAQAAGGSALPNLISVQQVSGRNLGYIDFLVPGMLGLTMMNLGLFSVAFGFVQLKRTGALRRLFATPTPPGYFLAAQVSSRLILSIMQVLILLGVGLWFGLHLVGSLPLLIAVAMLGGIIFLALGFAIAGWAKNEDQAAPVANLVSLPMTFLSGVFFSRDAMPDFLRTITDFLPLTYLTDALRRITNDGVGVTALGTDLLGLSVWAVVAFLIAVRLFRWE